MTRTGHEDMPVRRAAVAGSWYPGDPVRLAADVDGLLAAADLNPRHAPPDEAEIVALIAPHAGLTYSGTVAAYAYRLLRRRTYDTIVLVGPSHRVAFDGVSVWPKGAFASPLGELRIDHRTAAAIAAACPLIGDWPEAHDAEHSLEMQLPFLARIAPGAQIVPLVMGHQTRATAETLGDALATVLAGQRVLLVASSDLSHFFDATTASFLDAQVVEHIEALDPDGLMARLEQRHDHACGGGPIVSVLRAARKMGATTSRVLRYADSGDITGDKGSVVGYLAAALWRLPS
jgi:MEMO1 family protein